MLKRLLYEPLLHFLILGGLLFLFYAFSENKDEAQNAVVISKERIKMLISDAEDKSMTILTEEEKKKIIDKEVYETVLYKEALKTGLNISAIDLKRHLVDKIEFVLYNREEVPSPSDEALKTFMSKNVDDYREEQKIHFRQNIMGGQSESFEKEYRLNDFEASSIFGRAFSEELFKLKADGKVHTLESDYGIHEIEIVNNAKGKLKSFEDIKETLKNDYFKAERKEQNEIIYEGLKAKYTINVEEK